MYRQETLDFSKPLFCNSAFAFNGKHYQVGDPFPWRQIACSHRRVAQMHQARKLRHKLPNSEGEKLDVSATPATQLPTDPPPQGKEPPTVTSEQSEPSAEPSAKPSAKPSATTAELVHTGAGWYNVEVFGAPANESKIKGKQAAIDWATENGYEISS